MVADFLRRFWVSLVLTLPVLALAPMVQQVLGMGQVLSFPGDTLVQMAFASVIFFYGGWPFLTGMVREIRGRQPGMMTLIGLAITVAWTYSSMVTLGLKGEVFFWELATLIDIMLLGHWIEMRSVMGASRALEVLATLMPSEAHLLASDGTIEKVLVTELRHGDRVVVKPGEKVPTDGLIVEGRSTFNEAMLTGESNPVERGPEDVVIGGAINGEAAITFEVSKTGEETYLSQIIEIVRVAQQSRSKTQDLANRAAKWLTFLAIGAGLLTLVVWLMVGSSFSYALERMVTVMVITCPHALGLAVPLVVAASTSLAARSGLLIRDRSAFERAKDLTAVVFDKTGTLTEGNFGVMEVIPLGSFDQEEVLRLAASLESRSEHPIAAGIVHKARVAGVQYPDPVAFRAIPGRGAEAEVEGMSVKMVSPGYLEEHGLSVRDDRISVMSLQGRTIVYLVVDGAVVGALGLADIIRPESQEAIQELRALHVQPMMLTGDSAPVAEWVAGELGIVDYFAEVLPHEKSEKVRELKARGLTVAMTGDGVNDAPALVEADVGIAIGAGTDVAVESADIVLVRSDPRDVSSIIILARRTYRKMVQNLWWATGYNLVAIPLAAGVLSGVGIVLSPAVGAALMSMSTIIVAINARLLGRGGP